MAHTLLNTWRDSEIFQQIITDSGLKENYRIALTGLDGSARHFVEAALADHYSSKTVIITKDLSEAEKVYAALNTYLPARVNLLPARDLFVSGEIETRSEELQHKRTAFMQWAFEEGRGIYIAPVAALINRTLPPRSWENLKLAINPGQELNRQDLIASLVELGYERASLTEMKGQFSARGDIIDIFPPGLEDPVRIELFGDLVDSLRYYDPFTQRKKEKVDFVNIYPAKELLIGKDRFSAGELKLKKKLEKALSALRRAGNRDLAARLNQQVTRHLDKLALPDGLDILPPYLHFFYPGEASLIDYLPQDCLLILDEPADIALQAGQLAGELKEYHAGLLYYADMLESVSGMPLDLGEQLRKRPGPLISCALFSGTGGLFNAGRELGIDAKAAPSYHGQWTLFHEDYSIWQREGYRICLLTDSKERGEGLLNLLNEHGALPGERRASREDMPPAIELVNGRLEEGFIMPSLKLVLLSEYNLVPRRRKRRPSGSRDKGVKLSDYRELIPGDYVVHEHHGVGLYQGLHTLEVGGIKRDYLHLKYRGTDKLYLPIDQVGMIQKYSGGDGPAPRLHALGGSEWQRLKSRVNQSVEQLARELLALYAARQAVEGYRYAADHPWQQEFEANFPYEETPDQMRAIREVKADLEKNHPMDRLICGDVGYGKTEVAMRAAFKVVMEGKQVAILVPTTILAQQHYRTFGERFEGFPFKVAQLSRFVSPAKQKEVVKDLAAGKIDIVIGTHRLLSGDIRFNDLGLLVIDEEQRFGVKQKEKMKQMRLEVDTLAMTATPIPRTLHLSLAGARDLSIIDTPPEDRYPVQTYVAEYSEVMVKEVIQRELNRQGQIFIVYNRVERINSFADKLQALFPDIDIAVGHGQMPEKRLEKVMIDFQEGYYQILVSSTIIESGLDIPNVNTLIVCEADRFGLAQLYQIRGRVGRSNRVAYAYLTYRKDKIISETAKKRLRAIKEFTELGSGFKIALRDLEIRGAGNILGAEQHGFIAQVGFDLYVKLLDQAVAELKNEKREKEVSTRLELQTNAYLPASYINMQDQKIDFYQRIYRAKTVAELHELEEEMKDRYASPPLPVSNLIKVACLRLAASELGIELLQEKGDELLIQFAKGTSPDFEQWSALPFFEKRQLKSSSANPLTLKIKNRRGETYTLDALLTFFGSLAGHELCAGSKQGI